MSWTFFWLSLVGAAFTLTALVRARDIYWFVVPWFFASWLTGELALHHIAWQAVATLFFISRGALAEWPGVVGLLVTGCSWAGLLVAWRRGQGSGEVFREAVRSGLRDGGVDVAAGTSATVAAAEAERPQPSDWVQPFRFRRPGVERIRNVSYGDAGKRNLLDIYRPVGAREGCPVLVQIHGGGWMIGNKEEQGLPLMYHLAERGWFCIAPNYRLSPKATFPDHIVDVKRAIAWARAHAHEYGGDPGFIAITGGSAGGHLSSLAALTANRPEFQPGFEDADTSVDACVPFYGVYDFLERHGARDNASMRPYLGKYVFKCRPEDDPELWRAACSLDHVHADAPPFYVIHGTHDSLAFVEDARDFVAALRATSRNPVAYAELEGAQHAFEIFHSPRCEHAIRSVAVFLEAVRASRGRQEKGEQSGLASRVA